MAAMNIRVFHMIRPGGRSVATQVFWEANFPSGFRQSMAVFSDCCPPFSASWMDHPVACDVSCE